METDRRTGCASGIDPTGRRSAAVRMTPVRHQLEGKAFDVGPDPAAIASPAGFCYASRAKHARLGDPNRNSGAVEPTRFAAYEPAWSKRRRSHIRSGPEGVNICRVRWVHRPSGPSCLADGLPRSGSTPKPRVAPADPRASSPKEYPAPKALNGTPSPRFPLWGASRNPGPDEAARSAQAVRPVASGGTTGIDLRAAGFAAVGSRCKKAAP